MDPTMPLPKCPNHHCFMQYRAGEFPERVVYCPECHDHWVEGGTDFYNRVHLSPWNDC